MHSRDWNVGEGIPSQIFRSVADSRKTIIVLSQVNTLWISIRRVLMMMIHKMMMMIFKMMINIVTMMMMIVIMMIIIVIMIMRIVINN